MSGNDADPRALWPPVAATPNAETVLQWLYSLAVLVGFLTFAILLVTFELVGRT